MKSTEKTTEESAFSFFSGALWADKDEYVAKNLVFTIGKIVFEKGGGFEGADRWAIYVQADDGRSEEIITLQSNEKRAAELVAAAAHIERLGPIPNVKLVKARKAYYFRSATKTKAS